MYELLLLQELSKDATPQSVPGTARTSKLQLNISFVPASEVLLITVKCHTQVALLSTLVRRTSDIDNSPDGSIDVVRTAATRPAENKKRSRGQHFIVDKFQPKLPNKV